MSGKSICCQYSVDFDQQIGLLLTGATERALFTKMGSK